MCLFVHPVCIKSSTISISLPFALPSNNLITLSSQILCFAQYRVSYHSNSFENLFFAHWSGNTIVIFLSIMSFIFHIQVWNSTLILKSLKKNLCSKEWISKICRVVLVIKAGRIERISAKYFEVATSHISIILSIVPIGKKGINISIFFCLI